MQGDSDSVLIMRPDLSGAVIAGVAFVDVINTLLDETIPLTVIEWDEWGNPKDAEQYRWIRPYSPYDNITSQAYPNEFFLAGLNDPRVGWLGAREVCCKASVRIGPTTTYS